MLHFLLFITLFLTIYGGLHLYFYRRVRRGFALTGRWRIAFIFILVLMVLGPLVTRVMESNGWLEVARLWGTVVFGWMGTLIIAVSIFFLADILRYLGRVLNYTVHTTLSLGSVGWRRVVIGVIALSVTASFCGHFAARQIDIERVRIVTDKLPPAVRDYRMVQLTDLHLGLMTDGEWLSRIVDKVNSLEPDLIVATGDIIDSRITTARPYREMLARLQAHDGKYAVAGNHEFFADIDKSVDYMQQAGFVMLRGEQVAVTPWLDLMGVDDREGRLTDGSGVDHEALLMKGVDSRAFNILLKHQPVVRERSIGKFDLQLAGHVHQGQIFPLRLITWLVYPVPMGLSDLGQGSRLYVSRGAGTWGPPIRVMAPPEITLFEFVRP